MLLPPALLALLSALSPLCDDVVRHAPVGVVAEHFDWYREDDAGGRPIARLGLSVVRLADGTEHAFLRVAAEGFGVASEPGFDAVPDANLVTARELDRALSEHRLRFELVRLDGEALPAGIASEVELAITRQEAPRRRRLEQGGGFSIGRAGDPLPLELSAWTGALPLGRSALVVRLDGVPRLRIGFERSEGTASRIVALRSLPGRQR